MAARDSNRRTRIFETWLKREHPGARKLGGRNSKGERPLGSVSTGWPDFAVLMPDETLCFFEVKGKGEGVYTGQKEMLQHLRKIAKTYVARVSVSKSSVSLEPV